MASPKSVGFVIAIAMMMLTISLAWSLQGCPENERKALLSFKHGVASPSNRLSSWGGHDCCKWNGVGCDNETGHVVRLDLHNPFPYNDDRAFLDDRDLLYEKSCLDMAEVSPSLVQLKHLNYLDLSGNNFSGSRIPDFFGSFLKLRYLNLSCAWFGGQIPHHLGNLSSLSSLDLNSAYCNYPYQLTVDTFRWTLNLFSLKHLDMSGINLTHLQAHSSHITTLLPYSLSELRLASSCWLTRPFLINIIRNMTLLRVLDFSDNYVGGIFPNFILNMTSLTSLDLSFNYFTSSGQILDELTSLENLKSLDLSFNDFSGVLPNFSYHLHNLEQLQLSSNSFHGPISASFGTFSNMKLLDLSWNELTGSIPSSLGRLSAIESLDLGWNELTGSIPSSLGRLSAIESLDLRLNKLTGSIPTSIGNLSNLKSLYLYSNQLTGSIPTSIGNLSNLKSLHLSANKLSGPFPMSLGKLFNLEDLGLSNNSINGVVSEVHFAKLSKLKHLDLGYNFFLSFKITPGWAPPFQLEQIYLSDCQVGPRFPDWLRTQTRLKYLSMSNSSISGSIPNWFSDISNALRLLDLSLNNITGSIPYSLCSSKELESLSLKKNRLSGELPRCWNNSVFSVVDFSFNQITGSIPNSFCDFGLLQFLSLSHNNLSGQLPRCWSNPNLEFLFLSYNLFHGEIPKNLKNCTGLWGLDLGENSLSGEIPSWIGDLSHLQLLRLRSNKLTGILSTNLCDLEYLQILDVGENHLFGTIPYCFGNFNQMSLNRTSSGLSSNGSEITQLIKGIEREYTTILGLLVNMDLSSNNLVGHIPEELTKLKGLISLNLSRNNFTGQVPYKIGNMISLESLDLSLNRLSGRIPQSISSLTSLSVLDVSYNNLSGPIPTGNQLQTFNDPTRYQGNDELCGPPLPKTCTSFHDPTYVDKAHKEDDDSNMVLFYISPILGFVVGFWVVCGSLFLKETWRRAYFQFVDDIPEKVFRVLSVIARLKEKLKGQLNCRI